MRLTSAGNDTQEVSLALAAVLIGGSLGVRKCDFLVNC